MATYSRQVAVFWDVEDCPPLPDISGYDIVNSLRRATIPYGNLTSIKAYFRSSTINAGQVQIHVLKRELQLAGVQIVEIYDSQQEVPANSSILIGDLFSHSMDQSPAAIMLIAANIDLSYVLGLLRNRRLSVTLVAPLERVHESLKFQATATLDWYNDVLGVQRPQVSQHAANGVWPVNNSHQPQASTTSFGSYSSSRDEVREEDRNDSSKGPSLIQRPAPLTVMNLTHTSTQFQSLFSQPIFPPAVPITDGAQRNGKNPYRTSDSWRPSSSSTLRSVRRSRSRSPPAPFVAQQNPTEHRHESPLSDQSSEQFPALDSMAPYNHPPGPPRNLPLNEDKLAQPFPRWPVHADALTRGLYTDRLSARSSPDLGRQAHLDPQTRQISPPMAAVTLPFLVPPTSPPPIHNPADLSLLSHPDELASNSILKAIAAQAPGLSPPPLPAHLQPGLSFPMDSQPGTSAHAPLIPSETPSHANTQFNDPQYQTFLPLIAKLQSLRKAGREPASASDAGAIRGDKKKLYQAVGVSTFTQYLEAARRAGIVELEVLPTRETMVKLIV
ncbi:hypothetical protein AX16_010478 [Volvariella volvacea WC 439]|nr:hypothetical protein AX16_010478 [Volvariella volvacea WC 439]